MADELMDNRESLAATIKKSRDYGRFQLRGDNRMVSSKHVKNLAESMAENPKLFMHRPILVNEKYEVMDGQHRLAAARMLNMPVYYTVAMGMGIKETRKINATQANWSPLDYARSYADEGKSAYQRYLKYREEYQVGHNIIMDFMMSKNTHTMSKAFRSGLLDEKSPVQTKMLLDHIESIKPFVPAVYARRGFASAFRRMVLTEGYDHAWFLKNVERVGDKYLGRLLTVEDYMRALENVYNEHAREDKRMRIY